MSEIIINSSILWSNSSYGINAGLFGESSISISYSNVKGGPHANDGITWLQGNINSEPLFTDPVNGDFHLSTGSPCINAGDPSYPSDPDGTRTEMGRYYFECNLQELDEINGTISNGYYFVSGNVHVTGNATIEQDATLTIAPELQLSSMAIIQ